MTDDETKAGHETVAGIIDRILGRYHQVHRAELPDLVAPAAKVETVRSGHPAAPRGMAETLGRMLTELDGHMRKEETTPFPAMHSGGMPGIDGPTSVMRADHEAHEHAIARIRAITQDLTLPEGACGSWRRLHAGTAKLLRDLAEHARLENEVPFPRFEKAA